MLKIENTEVMGWEHAIRGMRNPKNSWERSDSADGCPPIPCEDCPGHNDRDKCNEIFAGGKFTIGTNDHQLMMNLAHGGPVHAKYRRMITVYLDITAPLYWWKEFDTYKVGTVANSCSTMHKIHAKEFTLEDFSCEHLSCIDIGGVGAPHQILKNLIRALNDCRKLYLQTRDKEYWWQMIQLLPTSYNQKRTVMLNYEVLVNIYESRRHHKLDEWHTFCDWIESLPYSELIVGEKEEEVAE